MKKILLLISIFSVLTFSSKAQNVKSAYTSLLQSYFDLKNALSKDQGMDAQSAAKAMLVKFRSFPVKQLSAVQQSEWHAQSAPIVKYVNIISAEKDLKGQRKSFEGMAPAMVRLARSFKWNDAKMYVQYCPMIKKSWLNEVEEIQNPFYGSKMYDCGEVTDKI